ncbi:MAG TPA: universal stress protein [Nakamurella sp.]
MNDIDVHERFTNLIVVGIDESEGARAAAQWAAKEAAQRHAALHLVSAYPTRIGTGVADVVPGLAHQDALKELQRQVQAELIEAHPGLKVTGIVAYEESIPLLLRESAHALMLVVATRGAGRLSHVALGSVAFGVASRAQLPVVVVRPGIDLVEPCGPVVVGIDGSPVSEKALGFAFEAASVHGTSLLAVHAWDADRAFDPEAAQATVDRVTLDDLAEVERVVLAERLAGWRERYPDVPVESTLLTEHAADGLERLSKKAQLVVVGSRGRNRFAGALLGSTSQYLIVHAASPVVVVRPDDRH